MSIQVMNDTSSVVTLKISQNFDIIINEFALKINRGRAIYVGVRELPFWILRFIALKKKENPQREAMILWKKNKQTSDIERKINDYFSMHFPHVDEIYFESNKKSAEEMNNFLKNTSNHFTNQQSVS
jgi:hypothetical protein